MVTDNNGRHLPDKHVLFSYSVFITFLANKPLLSSRKTILSLLKKLIQFMANVGDLILLQQYSFFVPLCHNDISPTSPVRNLSLPITHVQCSNISQSYNCLLQQINIRKIVTKINKVKIYTYGITNIMTTDSAVSYTHLDVYKRQECINTNVITSYMI